MAQVKERNSAVELDRIRTILRHAPVVLFAFDADGVFTLSEGSGLYPLGLRGGDAVGRSLFELYADSPAIVSAARRVLAGERVSSSVEADGCWYTTEYVPLRDASGRVVGGAGIAIEVTARLEAADLLGSLDVIVFVADAATLRVSFVSTRAVSLLGYGVGDWLGDADFWTRHLHPDERAVTLSLWRQVAADGVERACVHRLVAADGRSRWFRTTVRGVARDGAVHALVGVMLEVTERIGSQTVLAESEQRFRLMFDQLPAVVYTIDRALRFTTGAGSGLARLGLSPDQTVTGITLYEYFHTRDPRDANIVAHLRAVAGESVDFEAHWLGRTFQTHVDPFRDTAGNIIGAIGVALDVTERKRAEAERDRLLAEEQAARAAAERAVRARDEFLMVAAHELFTPITALQLSLQSLERAEQSGGSRQQHVATAVRQVRRLTRLIADLLDVSRIQSGRVELARAEVDLAALVREVAARFAPELTHAGIALAVAADAPVRGHWDRSRLDQVVTNLLSNAIKYGAGRPIDVVVERVGERARLVVRDRGIGIASEALPRIFERFERGVPARSYAGMGLGLFIVRSIVEAHGGTVSAASTPGAGAAFTVELPLA